MASLKPPNILSVAIHGRSRRPLAKEGWTRRSGSKSRWGDGAEPDTG